MATGGVAVEPRNLQATEIQGFSVRCRKSRGDLAAQESQKVSGESLFDLIVTIERRKKYIIPTVEYLGPWKIFALSEKWGHHGELEHLRHVCPKRSLGGV